MARVYFLPGITFFLGILVALNLPSSQVECMSEQAEYNGYADDTSSYDLIILILSAPQNFDVRNTLRETYLTLGKDSTVTWKHFFVVGSVDQDESVVSAIKREGEEFQDVTILPIKEKYELLTNKLLHSLVWLNRSVEFKYVLKCDDDSFVNLEKLLEEIKSVDGRSRDCLESLKTPFTYSDFQYNDGDTNCEHLYWGYFYGRSRVKSSGKWKETKWIFCDHYLPYAVGGGYIISRGVVQFVANNANYLRSYRNEDVSMGLWLAPMTGIERRHDVRFDTEWNARGCNNSNLVVHHQPPEKIKEMFKNLQVRGQLCETEYADRKPNLFGFFEK